MKRVLTLACCLCLLALAAPAVHAAGEAAPGLDPAPAPAPEPTAPSTSEAALAPDPTPEAMSQSCSDPYTPGYVYLPPSQGGDPQTACTEKCAQSGGTFYAYEDFGRYIYFCYCCPA